MKEILKNMEVQVNGRVTVDSGDAVLEQLNKENLDLYDFVKETKKTALDPDGIEVRMVENLDGEGDRYSFEVVCHQIDFCRRYMAQNIKRIYDDLRMNGYKVQNLDILNDKVKNVEVNESTDCVHHLPGWQEYKGERIFKWKYAFSAEGRQFSSYDGDLELEAKGTVEEYAAGIRELVAPYPNLVAVYVASATGMVTMELQEPDTNIMLNICGLSGTGKTTAEHTALSFWGNPKKLETSFNATVNYTEQVMADRLLMPVIIDDILAGHHYKPEAAQQSFLSAQIFRYSTGKIKGRCNEKERQYYGASISSSETALFQKISGNGIDGQYYRMTELCVKKGDLTKDALHARRLDRFARNHYGHGPEVMGRYMLEHDLVGDELANRYFEWTERLWKDSRLKDYERVVNRLAVIMLTAEILNQCFELDLDMDTLLTVFIQNLERVFAYINISERSYQNLCTAVQDNRALFAAEPKDYDPLQHVGVILGGFYDHEELLLEPERFELLVNGVSPQSILENHCTSEKKPKQLLTNHKLTDLLKDWRTKDWLICNRNRFTRKRRMGNRKEVAVYSVRLEDCCHE